MQKLGLIFAAFFFIGVLSVNLVWAGSAQKGWRPFPFDIRASDQRILVSELVVAASDDELLSGDDDELLSGDDDELLSGDDDDLLTDEDVLDEHVLTEEEPEAAELPTGQALDTHKGLFVGNRYPSANACATCHEKQYTEWSVSQHAYAQLSPVYMALQTTINIKTSGTNGDFCIRCHNQVGMNLKESVYISNLDRPATSREGITCVVCHRVDQPYGKVSGRLALSEGDLFDAVNGPTGGKELERVISEPEKYRVVTKRDEPGRAIHTEANKFFQLVTPGFCGTCHDVMLSNGFRLEDAFSEYKDSPAARNKVSCQDCHMGKVQGANAGYEYGPAAVIGGVPTATRRITNHFFAGPDSSIVHPGIFPHNVRAAEFKTLREWLQFDHEAGWGTDKFEDSLADDVEFPASWISIDDRYDAREIITEQLDRLKWATHQREEVLRNGFGLGEVELDQANERGIKFLVPVRNLTDGHAVPTGFDAERAIFLEVKVHDQSGNLIYVSGDRDPNGDLRDEHSLYVHNGELPLDRDLFSLQSKFLVRLFRGGEREQVLPINESVSVLPFVRPERRATSIYGRPLGARKHKRTLEPLGVRYASYKIDGGLLAGPGIYDVSIKLISQSVPVNLISAIQGAGFDYGMSPKEIGESIVSGADLIVEKYLKIDTRTGTVREVGVSEWGVVTD